MLMSDLTHSSLACKAHLNMSIENALYKFNSFKFNSFISLIQVVKVTGSPDRLLKDPRLKLFARSQLVLLKVK